MNRIIKFRAWDKEKRMMFEPSSISWKNGVLWVCDAHGENKLEYELIAPNSQLMQFTGLLDRNGVLIYEGDIVKVRRDTRYSQEVVEFDGGAFYAGMHHGSSTKKRIKLLIPKMVEIIGNVFENPELISNLEEKQ